MSGKKYSRDYGDSYLPGRNADFNPLIDGNLRNTPCLCGSGKKVKKCHGVKRIITSEDAQLIKDLALDAKKVLEEQLAAYKSTEGDINGDASERTQTR